MTKLSDAEINKALALKIGYLPEHVKLNALGDIMVNRPLLRGHTLWIVFDYKKWNTIMPIAVRYGVITGHTARPKPHYAGILGFGIVSAETLQRAIALAVLGAKE